MRWWWLVLLVGCHWFDASTSYTVVKGDTLSRIAREYDVTVAELKTWNGLSSDRIEIGQVLSIRSAATPEPPPPKKAAPTKRTSRPRSTTQRPSSGRPSAATPSAAPDTDVAVESSGPARLSLSMPSAKRCLAGPDVQGDEGMAASQGLTQQQIRTAVDRFLPRVLPCVTEAPPGPMQLAFVVGCNGRVRSVRPASDPGWPSRLTGCVVDAFHKAPFPAHDLPAGETFTIPLQFD